MPTFTAHDVHLGFLEVPATPGSTFICDIDGTIADLTHRRKWIEDKPKNWEAFEKGMLDDEPIHHIIALIDNLVLTLGLKMVFCSGRGEQNRDVTEQWLSTHVQAPYEKLYMRSYKDYRADDIIKGELLDKILQDGYNPSFVLDDRDRVVAMWRDRGLTCIQVAEGDF